MDKKSSATPGTMPGSTSSRTTGSSAGAGARSSTGTPGMQSEGTADKARNVAHEAQHKAADTARSGLDMGKDRAASALHGVADSLIQSCDTDEGGVTRYIRQAGERVQRAADYLDRTDSREMIRHTEQFARRQPALFLGGAFGLGLIAARFLKSSSRNDQNDSRYDSQSMGSQRAALYDRERPIAGSSTGMADRAGGIGATGGLGIENRGAASAGSGMTGTGATATSGTGSPTRPGASGSASQGTSERKSR